MSRVNKDDGGLYGWVVVFASHILLALVLGCQIGMGVFLVQFMECFGKGAGKTATIQAILSAMMLCPAPLINSLNVGTRPLVIFGGIVSSIGIFICSFANSVNLLIISYGMVVGIGFAFLYGQSIIIVGKYFYRRHALANGIAYAGGAVGIMALPPLYQVLINKYGWRGAMIVMSGINMHSIVSGMLMRPPPKHDSSETLDTMNNAPIMDETCVIESKVKKEKEGTLTETNYKQCQVHQNRCDESDATERKNIGNRNPKKLRTKIVVKFGLYLFTDSWFNILCITAFLSALGHLAVMAHLISNAASYGIPKLDAAFLMTILGIGALGGRATHGWFVDLGHFSPMFVVAGAWCAAGTVVLLLLIANGNYIVYACLSVSYGFLSGIAIPLNGAVCMKACLPNETFPTAFGWFLSLLGLGNLLGPVLAGWIYDATSNYNMSFLLAGIILILTGLLIFMQIIYKRCRRKKLGMDTQEKEESLLRIPGNTITSSNSVIQKVTTV